MKKINSEEIVEMRISGMTYREICKKTGFSKASVSKYCRGINKKFEIYEVNNKITKELIEYAQSIYDKGYSLKYVGEQVGVSRQTLSKYIKKRKRKYRTDEYIKRCSVDRVKKWKKNIKLEFVNMKGGCCCICGYNKSYRALHFHHIDPSEKDINLSSGSVSKESLIREVEKCILVCSNCHCEIHDEIQEKGYSEIILKLKENILSF